jgi:hemerythrin-like domain-containing protein
MITATKNLENDHVNILRLIDVMENMSVHKSTDAVHIATVIELIRNYADGVHHAKEEELLFPLLVKKGFSSEQGPIAVMLHEHNLGRNFVRGMTEGLKQYKEGNSTALTMVYDNMTEYRQLLRGHIDKENNVLFRMADKILSYDEQQHLLNEFAKVENSNICGEAFGKCLQSIDDLETIYHK